MFLHSLKSPPQHHVSLSHSLGKPRYSKDVDQIASEAIA